MKGLMMVDGVIKDICYNWCEKGVVINIYYDNYNVGIVGVLYFDFS